MSSDDLRRTIMVVDDQPENIDLLVSILGPDYLVKAATGGQGALRVARSETPPDLILLDIVMPEMDGYEVCRQLKADDRTRDITVIFVTGKGGTEDEARGLKLGAVDYITKPVSPQIVRARVKTHLELKLALRKMEEQNEELREAAQLREDVERISRHDLKNPLAVIIGSAQLLMVGANVDSVEHKRFKMIEDASYRMLNMINRSLDLFKMERGTYQFQPVRVDLLGVVRNILVDQDNLAQAKGLSVEVWVHGEPAGKRECFFALGEKLLCHSMLANLIDNALEACPEGESVTIDLKKDDSVRIAIHNAGAIPEEIRDTFFDKYVTFDKMGGTGLGTYSAK
ncbi:MAG: response regulator, partial [bacterium]|nr:response regulator [bacterium]